VKVVGRRARLEMRSAHRIAARIQSALHAAFLAGIRRARQEVSLTELAAVMHTGDVHRVLNAIPWTEIGSRMTERFRGPLHRAFVDAATAQAQPVQKDAADTLAYGFDETNPRAVRWALENAAGTVTGITEETRAAIRALIGRMFIEGIPPAKAAQMLRELIGLTPRLAVAAMNYREQIEADPDRDPEQAQRMADRYDQRLLNSRAEMIARTESMRAANAGQQEVWSQAADTGLLDRAHTQRLWLITPDEATCPVCTSIADAGPVGVEEPFVSDEGDSFFTPPAHPSCRCTMRLVFPD
jgi:Phage Mu protein F like protein